MTATVAPSPVVDPSGALPIAADIVLIPSRDVDLVPNIGIIGGSDAVLVVDTGMGPGNGRRVADFAEHYANGRRLFLTTTHFHPEHAFGAQSFIGRASYVLNRAQARDRADRGRAYLQMFRDLGEPVAGELTGVELNPPDEVYDDVFALDLGDRVVELRPTGRGHTRGDQVVRIPDADVLFTGDLVETGQFAIVPWFPPHDIDVSGPGWIEVLRRLVTSSPGLVVPGHGEVGGPERLADVLDYLELLRDETWAGREKGGTEESVGEDVAALMARRHPDWRGREWIQPGVGCFYNQHPDR